MNQILQLLRAAHNHDFGISESMHQLLLGISDVKLPSLSVTFMRKTANKKMLLVNDESPQRQVSP